MRRANIKQAAKVNLGSVWVVHGWGEAKMGFYAWAGNEGPHYHALARSHRRLD